MGALLFPLKITGSPLSTDVSPNSSAPDASRLWSAPQHTWDGSDDSSALVLTVDDGTSATVQLWQLVDGATTWSKIGGGVTVSAAQITEPQQIVKGPSIFAQITATAGNPTTLRAAFMKPQPGSATATTVAQGTPGASPWLVQLTESTSANAWSVAKSSALAASLQIKTSAAVLRSVTARVDSTAPTATYYVQLVDAASLPGDGAVTHLVAPLKVQHSSGTDDLLTIDLAEEGIAATNGAFLVLSSSEFTKTISGSYLSATAEYV